MGIRGLKRFIKETFADVFKAQFLVPGSTVIIDGNGWIFNLLENPQARTIVATPGMLKHLFPRSVSPEPLVRSDGGDYDLLDKRVKVFIGLMRRAGIEVEVLWDGPLVPKFKEEVLRKRNEERSLEELKLFRHCMHGERFTEGEYPLLPLALQQLRTTLAGLKVRQMECSSEADSILALRSAKDKTGRTFVLGNDSDFYLFKDCRYVNFSDVVFVRPQGADPAEQTVQVAVNVYTRAALSKLLAVSEKFLVDFAIYLGNDYTGPYGRQEFKIMDSDSKQMLLPYIAQTADAFVLLLQNAKESAIFSTNENQQLAIDFSRLLYDLKPLKNFEFQPKNSPVEAADRKTTISEMVDALLDASTRDHNAKLMRPGESIFHAALRIMSTQLPDMTPNSPMNQVRRAVLEAIGTGKFKIQAHKQHQFADDTLTWEDVRFAFCYQNICRRLYSVLRQDYAPPSAWLEPRQIFSGPAYKHLLHLYRTQVAQRSPPSLLAEEDPNKASVLPIDAHRERILDHIHRHRVTIIHGETGCGKSSRVPVMLYKDSSKTKPVKLFVSQPRRIACTALHSRLSEELGDVVGLRLGHGVRVETSRTRIWYCTAGYLKLLSAHRPRTFKTHTHLIIDEIHERSVDTDLLCFFAKELLVTYPHLKLVLMSATLCVETYRKYFDVEEDAIFVGVKRFPLTEHHLDDIAQMNTFPRMIQSRAQNLITRMKNIRVSERVNKTLADNQVKIAVDVAKAVSKPGRSVLIFVAGIYTIGQIAEEFEKCPDIFRLVAIHSQIPFEEQLQAFENDPSRATIVVATNAAESSITLPDCDNVICLGSAKRIEYNERKRRVQLVHRWISRASAVQRAGRTARIAPGTVWRLYTKELFSRMDEFEPPEMHQIPLDHVVLQLRSQISDRSVVDILRRVLDPPDLTHIKHAFASLFQYGYISEASDEGEITDSGAIAVKLGLDLTLTKLVIYGIHLGVAKETVYMAAALAQQDLPFRKASEYIHTPKELNEIVRDSISGQAFFDRGLYSTPLMLLRIIVWWRTRGGGRGAGQQLRKLALVRRRVRQLDQAAIHLERRLGPPFVDADAPLRDIIRSPRTVERLRLCLIWTFAERLVRMKPIPVPAGDKYQIILKPWHTNSGKITQAHLDRLLRGTGPFMLSGVSEKMFQMQLPGTCTQTEMREVAGHILYNDTMDNVPLRWLIWRSNKKKKTMIIMARIPTPDEPASQRNAYENVLSGIEKIKEEYGVEEHGDQDDFRIFMCEKIKDRIVNELLKALKPRSPVWLGMNLLQNQCVNIVGSAVPALSKEFLLSQVPACEAVRPINTKEKLTLQFPLTPPAPSALAHDLPLGVRVLLSSVGHRRRSELLLAPEPSAAAAIGSSSYVPVGLAQPEDTSSEPEPLKFKLLSSSTSWVAVGGSSESNCKVNTRSLVGLSSHMGTDPVHGVAASALYLGEDASFVILGNLTLFPRGPWVERGLYCVAGTCAENVDSNSHSNSDRDDYDSYADESQSDSDEGIMNAQQPEWQKHAEVLQESIKQDYIPMATGRYRRHVTHNLRLLNKIFSEIRNDAPQDQLEQIAAEIMSKKCQQNVVGKSASPRKSQKKKKITRTPTRQPPTSEKDHLHKVIQRVADPPSAGHSNRTRTDAAAAMATTSSSTSAENVNLDQS